MGSPRSALRPGARGGSAGGRSERARARAAGKRSGPRTGRRGASFPLAARRRDPSRDAPLQRGGECRNATPLGEDALTPPRIGLHAARGDAAVPAERAGRPRAASCPPARRKLPPVLPAQPRAGAARQPLLFPGALGCSERPLGRARRFRFSYAHPRGASRAAATGGSPAAAAVNADPHGAGLGSSPQSRGGEEPPPRGRAGERLSGAKARHPG